MLRDLCAKDGWSLADMHKVRFLARKLLDDGAALRGERDALLHLRDGSSSGAAQALANRLYDLRAVVDATYQEEIEDAVRRVLTEREILRTRLATVEGERDALRKGTDDDCGVHKYIFEQSEGRLAEARETLTTRDAEIGRLHTALADAAWYEHYDCAACGGQPGAHEEDCRLGRAEASRRAVLTTPTPGAR
jgi:hypothetical protein